MSKFDLDLASGEYAPVAARITLFYERFADGRIITELVSRSDDEVTFKAMVYRTASEREPAATGWASELEGDGDINTVACLENTETSAIGRALANLGFTASSRRPSAEEMLKAARTRARMRRAPADEARVIDDEPGARRTASESPPAPPVFSIADATLDALRLLRSAEQAGLDPIRVRSLRARLRAGASLASIERLESVLRKWRLGRPMLPDR